jgi:uncharacterized protein YxjI
MPINPNEHDVFLLRQRFRPVINQYEFHVPSNGGTGLGDFVCFAEQKRFKFKEDIRFYADDSKQLEVMRLKARQRFDPMARYDVTSPNGERIGQIQKLFGQSLLRSSYALYDANGNEVAQAREKSLGVALFRRAVDFIPYVDMVSDWLPIPYHFEFLAPGGVLLGTNTRQSFKLRDTYTIDMSPDTDHRLDRRLVLAIAVGMDALQAR